MLKAAIPTRFQKVWGVSAAGAFIRTVPVNSQIGIQDGAASFETGWVPDNFTPLAGGGVPPFGQDFNGLENVITAWLQWGQAGGPVSYDVTFSTAVSGYPQGAKVDSAIVLGAQWYSTVDGNTTNPDDPLTSIGWARVGLPVGTPLQFLTATVGPGFVPMNATTIGNAASNAGYANADALFLFCANWSQFTNGQCPILTSAGAPSTRGANPVADWLANKQLTLPNGKGLGLIGADTMAGGASTFLSGVPVTIGNTTTPGSILGENLHALISGENGPHAHTITDNGHAHSLTAAIITGGISSLSSGSQNIINTGITTSTNATGISINSSGSGTGHNTVERNMIVFWGQRL